MSKTSEPFRSPPILSDESRLAKVHSYLNDDDLRSAICCAFQVPMQDDYVYYATTGVSLSEAQAAIQAGRVNGLHSWYPDVNTNGGPVSNAYPDLSDIGGYISLFDPSKASGNTLKGMKANAKKGSLRADIAGYLFSKRYVDASISVSKSKKNHKNPYADFWAWSCRNLEWAGPMESTVNVKLSHHILPIFMHHFGCVCPSYESLEILKKLSNGKTILDIGSGNGYWTLMLRNQGCNVLAVDNAQSKWRTCWINDTIRTDGIKYIQKRPDSGRTDVLLLVYPIVGSDFTVKILEAYKGDTICVVGTQNGNGYTGLKDEMIDSWMNRNRKDFRKLVQIPLPSFAGKDDAFFAFGKT